MVDFINSLASPINASSLSPRATVLFNQAMATGRYRWGRKCKLVAGACIALALRENNRPDVLHDLAYLLGETFPTLVRTLSSVTAALGFSFTASDPTVYFPSFQTHLSSLLQNPSRQSESDSTLPASLMAQLEPLSLHTAVTTANSLASLFARFGPDHPINQLPAPPTACAFFLLALEAQLRAPLDHLGDLAASLGPRVHAKRGVLMARYKIVQEEVLALTYEVPWLDKYQSKNGRAKTGKRTVVARGLKDVLLFQEEIWKGRLKPTVVLDISDGENDGHLSEPQSDSTTLSTPPSSDRTKVHSDYSHSKKRRKTTHKPLHDAAQFLLDPLSAPIPQFGFPFSSVPLQPQSPLSPPHSSSVSPAPTQMSEVAATLSASSHSYLSSSSSRPTPLTLPSLLPLTSYLLTAPDCTSLTSRRSPTRLQLLAASRRGEEDIADEELFEEGELERLFRSEEEIESLRETFDWGGWEDTRDEEGNKRVRKKRKQKDVPGLLEDGLGVEKGKVSKRVNLEALARFMEDPTEEKDDLNNYDTAFLGLQRFDDEHEDEKDDDDDWQGLPCQSHQDGLSGSDMLKRPRTPTTAQNDEVVLNEWRPLSPESGIRYGGHSRYDEEYD
jgi:transcription factor IIIB 90 kDa subunit